MARVLVTGASGFLGHQVVRELKEQRHEVVALCRKPAPSLSALGAEVSRGDVLDVDSLERAARDCTVCIHAAGLVTRENGDALAMMEVHYKGTAQVIEACHRAQVRRLVHVSTSGTIAVSEEPIEWNEDAPTPYSIMGQWPYYRSKLYAEQEALRAKGLEVVVINPTLLLGPGDERGSSTHDVWLFLEKKIPGVPAGGLSFVDVRDAARGAVLAMERGVSGQRYLLTAANMSMKLYLSRLERLSGVRAPGLLAPKNHTLAAWGTKFLNRLQSARGLEGLDEVTAQMAQYFWYASSEKARTQLGFTTREPLDTLADTIAYLRESGRVWPEVA